jgi:UDP-glucuronate 4-epimerase
VKLKQDRRKILEAHPNFKFFHGDLLDLDSIEFVFRNYKIDKIVDLAAYAGIRHSFVDPLVYVKTNII